jgi:hypothetical protein
MASRLYCADVGERARIGVGDFANKLNDLRAGVLGAVGDWGAPRGSF